MARPLRIEMRNGIYHVTSRGWERRDIVDDDDDRERWVRMLDRAAKRRGWRIFAWTLMSNHFHLFLRTPQPNLAAGMHDLNSGYATGYNRRHRRVGSLFQGRYKAILVENESHAWELTRYIHLNAHRAGMAQRPEDYPWSSYRSFIYARHGRQAPPWLDWQTVLLERGNDLRAASRAYRRFVDSCVNKPLASPLEAAVEGLFLGAAEWIDRMRAHLSAEPEDRNVPAKRRMAPRPSAKDIVEAVTAHFEIGREMLSQTRRHRNEARAGALYLLRNLTDKRVKTLAEEYGGVSEAAISKVVRRAEDRRQEDRDWDRLLAKLEQEISTKS